MNKITVASTSYLNFIRIRNLKNQFILHHYDRSVEYTSVHHFAKFEIFFTVFQNKNDLFKILSRKKMNINTYALHVFIYCAFVIIFFFLNLGIVNDNF